jgi:hypothetical protein
VKGEAAVLVVVLVAVSEEVSEEVLVAARH